jgi:anti-sigma factor RsiW
MNCRQVRDLLPLYADNDLDDGSRQGVVQHLRGCPGCRMRLDLDRRLGPALAQVSTPTAAATDGASLRRKVMAEVEKERRWCPFWRTAGRLGNAAGWLAMSAVTALIVLGLSLTWKPMMQKAWPAANTQAANTPKPGTPAAATPA